MISKLFPLFLISTLAHADPVAEYQNTALALDLQSNSYCMDGFGVIQTSAGCSTLNLVRDDKDMTWIAQCIKKTESNPIIDAEYAFTPANYIATGKYAGYDVMCADGSFNLLRAPKTKVIKVYDVTP
jgi:hypothetical protein